MPSVCYMESVRDASMYRLRPFFIQLPCCGCHENEAMGGIKTYPLHEANVLVLSGTITKVVWDLVQKSYTAMDKPRWFVRLGASNQHLYDERFVSRLRLTPHVSVPVCPVTKETVEEAFYLLGEYVKKPGKN